MMSSREDIEVEHVCFELEKEIQREKEKENDLKNEIKKELTRLLENSNIRSTWSERDEAIEIAFQLRKNNILSEKTIVNKFNEMMRHAENKRNQTLKNFELFNQQIKNTVAPEFFEELWRKDYSKDQLESILEAYLRKTNKQTTIKEEKDILKIALDVVGQQIQLPEEVNKKYDEDVKNAKKWKNENLKLFQKYAEKINGGNFKDFFEKDFWSHVKLSEVIK